MANSHRVGSGKATIPTHENHELNVNKDTDSVKFYLRGRPITLYIPESHSANNSIMSAKIKAPAEHLKLEWIYGYRGKDCRHNLHALPNGECVYFMAAVVILYNIDKSTQRHYVEHTDDIKSLAVHPDGVTIATGQSTGHGSDAKAHVRVWDSVTMTTLRVIGLHGATNEFSNAVCCLSFSKCDGGALLCCLDDGTGGRWLSMWQWRACTKITSTKCSSEVVYALEFHPTESNRLVTCGKHHISFWLWNEREHQFAKHNGLFEALKRPDFVLAVAFMKSTGEVVSGDSEGNLMFWNFVENKVTRVIKEAHVGAVISILSIISSPNCSMVTGGKDGLITAWTGDFQRGRSLQIPHKNGTCRAITQMMPNTHRFLVGTTQNSIFEANFELDTIWCLVNGHCDELWGLSNNLREETFLTCGNDKLLCYWDTRSHSMLWSEQFKEQLHCVHIHPSRDLAAVGCTKNKWFVVDLKEHKVVHSQIEGKNI